MRASAFECDRRRDQRLGAAGYAALGIAWRQLVAEPTAVAVWIGQALAHAEIRRSAAA